MSSKYMFVTRVGVFIIFMLFQIHVFAQGFEEMKRVYQESRYSEVLNLYRLFNFKDSVSEMAGNACFQLGKYDSCIRFLKLTLVKDSNFVQRESYLNLAVSYVLTGRNEECVAELSKYLPYEGLIPLIYDRLGIIYLNEKKFDSALKYMHKGLDVNSPIMFQHAFYNLCLAYIAIGRTDTAIKMLLTLDSNKYYPYDKFAKILFDSINSVKGYKYSDFYPSNPHWVMVDGTNILYFFKDTTGWGKDNVAAYIKEHEQAYNELDSIFHYKLSYPATSKLTFYISNTYNGTVSSEKKAYTDAYASICYVSRQQSLGHEMTHALSYWGWGYKQINLTRLINEGVAVAFDLSKIDKFSSGRRAALNCYKIHSIIELWNYYPKPGTEPIINDKDFYAVAGGFVSYLFHRSTYNQFKSLIKNESLENAEKIYGVDNFKLLINEFNEQMDFK